MIRDIITDDSIVVESPFHDARYWFSCAHAKAWYRGYMVDTPQRDDHAEGDEPDTAEPAEPVCALEGCDNPLPGPSVDEQGRRKGGRPSSYCCKAHADTASRNRRAAQTASVVDPLVEARRLAEEFTPKAQPLLDMLRHVTERFEGAEQGAIGQVRQAQEDVAAAHTAAEDAQRRAEQAERARDKALATSRDEQQAREEAQRQAKQAADDAERVRQDAGAPVAEHERARGAAEAATESANTARDAAHADLRSAHQQPRGRRDTHSALRDELASVTTQLEESRAEHTLANERLDQARV